MKERPIIFNSAMIKAILDGRKTMLRRPLKKQPIDIIPMKVPDQWIALLQRNPNKGQVFRCRWGQPGDRLWCKHRWASRITLEITDVRVERLQEITDEDCFAEGLENICVDDPIASATWSPIPNFVYLWNSLYAKKHEYRWEENPWVFVVSFRKIT